jgi:cytochrome P450
VIVGASDMTRIAIAMQVALLLERREQWEQVCRDPARVSGAITEAMRFEPSVGSVVRATSEDVDVRGTIIPGGRLVTLSTVSAIRDEMVHDSTDIFDIH